MRFDLDELKSGCRLGALIGTLALTPALLPASTQTSWPGPWAAVTSPGASETVEQTFRFADFGTAAVTADVRSLADRIATSGDNGSSAFIVVDKRAAQLHVFDADARWVASTAVLLGAAKGDDSVPGIGTRPMAEIKLRERTTPAGRFIGESGFNAKGEDIVWMDYDAAVSIHRVRLNKARERRAQRLASPSAKDNRISYGCINVPPAFFDQHVQTVFRQRTAVIYVLPDQKSLHEVFGFYER
jgi:hypothetical protein